MKNLELKAIYSNELALKLVKNLELTSSDCLYQKDIYFNVNFGRLKLRSINNNKYELIRYSRPDLTNSKESTYEIYQPGDPELLLNMLTQSLGIKTIIKKTRNLFMFNNTRIHIDKVDDLGEFVEFEVLMIPDRLPSEAQEIMDLLINHFKIKQSDLIEGSYSDLLMNIQN